MLIRVLELRLYDDNKKYAIDIRADAIHEFAKRVNKAKEEGKMIHVEIMTKYIDEARVWLEKGEEKPKTRTMYIDAKAIKYINPVLIVGEEMNIL